MLLVRIFLETNSGQLLLNMVTKKAMEKKDGGIRDRCYCVIFEFFNSSNAFFGRLLAL